MATLENVCSNAPVKITNEEYACNTHSLQELEDKIESCNSQLVMENSIVTTPFTSEAESLFINKQTDVVQTSVNEKKLEVSNNCHCYTNSSTITENLDSNAVDNPHIMVQIASTESNSISDIDDFIAPVHLKSDFNLAHDGATLTKLPNSLESLDNDENTTQIRLSPTVAELENSSKNLNSGAAALSLSSTTSNHLCIQTTLTAQLPEDCQKQECNYSLVSSPEEDFDKDSDTSITSLNGCSESSDLNEICTPVTALEESSLDSGIASLDDNEQIMKSSSEPKHEKKQFMKLGLKPTSILGKKRRYKELSTPQAIEKEQTTKSRSRVSFDGVTVFYFPRKQSFVTVPSQGGSTLGMGLRHSHSKKMSLTQHKHVIARHRRKVIEQQKMQFRMDAKIKQLKQTYPNMEMAQLLSMVNENNETDESQESSDDEELDDVDDDNSSSDDEFDDNYYLQPIPAKKRRLLLRLAGVQKIDLDEKFSNKLTRESREVCGCDCEKVCLPSSCHCALAGIPCQVDRESFPCGCVVSGCCNPTGRVEFDAERVKKHYFQTMRKLRLQETGAIMVSEHEELPQPPKSPYVSALERDQQSERDNVKGGSSTNNYSLPNAEQVQSVHDHRMSMNSSTTFSFSAMESWTVPCNGSSMSSATNYASGDDMQNGTFDHFASGHESYFDSSSFSDVTSSFLAPELSSSEHIMSSSGPSGTPLGNFDSNFRDFSFAEEQFALSGESKLSSVFAEGNQLGSRQTFKLDPITTFFSCASSNNRRMSQESGLLLDLPDSCGHLGDVLDHPPIASSASPQPCSIESLLCADEQPVSRSRSSSLSECSHDSIIKA